LKEYASRFRADLNRWAFLTGSRAELAKVWQAFGVNVTKTEADRFFIADGFDAFHLTVKTIEGLLKKNKRGAAVKNTVGPVKLAFNVTPQGETLLIIDLVVTDFSDHPPRGYELGVKGYQLFTNGKLVEKIPPG
jgi:cytochrome oxidase Cu insertion factor (SCO1/SenC/PrrC family)